MMNLCANAEYAMRETGGVLELQLDMVEVDTGFPADYPPVTPGSYVRLSVRDTGRGMSPEVVPHIFEPFYTTKGIGEGTGMGLAIVHGIVLDHGGDLTVESAVGVGTTFRVYLPRLPGSTPVGVESPGPIPHGSGRILFVDDEEALVQVAQGMLSHLGYRVRASHRSLEALEWFRATPYDFDLVITDQTMPEMTGKALTHELRRLRPDIPIIVCTGFSYVMDEAKARDLGVDAFLHKPIVLKELALAIQGVFAKRRSTYRAG
jgi:CheY-like chemotaxis protein